MKTTLLSVMMALAALTTNHLQAQVPAAAAPAEPVPAEPAPSPTTNSTPVTYTFTATLTEGDTDFGATISGMVTSDVGAEPGFANPKAGYGEWYDGNFAINVVTSTGHSIGTGSLGHTTYAHGSGFQTVSDSITWSDGSGKKPASVSLSTVKAEPGDGTIAVADPWIVVGTDHVLSVFYFDPSTFSSHFANFTVDSFSAGKTSPGQAVSGQSQATQDQVKAGTMTKEERKEIVTTAAQSRGKKPDSKE